MDLATPRASAGAADSRVLTSTGMRYGFAIGMVVLFTGVRALLDPLLQWRAPLLVFTLGVAATARVAGFLPALVATGLSAIVGLYYFFPPSGSFVLSNSAETANVVVFLAEGTLLAWLGASLRDRALELAARAAWRDRILDVTDAGLGHRSANDLIDAVLERLRITFAADAAVLLWQADEGRTLELIGARGGLDAPTGMRLPIGYSIAGWVAAERQSRAVADLATSSLIAEPMRLLRQDMRGFVAVPLQSGTRLFGVIALTTRTVRLFSAEEIGLLEEMGERIGLIVENARLMETERGARREAEDANRAKDEFVASVSHELRTPLNVVQGWLWRLRRPDADPQLVQSGLATIERNVELQARLVDDLLDIARAITGKLRMQAVPLSLRDVVQRAIEASRDAAAAKDLTIDLSDSGRGDVIVGDPDRLQQVAGNLLSNAIKFTPPGGRVVVRIERDAVDVTLTVTDTGIGIVPEFLPHVFDRFRQQQSGSTRAYGGLGLGLAIVRQLVELHGGRVVAESDGTGHGATFRVYFPVPAVVPAVAAPSAAVSAPDVATLAGVRVLVVEDQQDAGETVAMVLRELGADVRLAASVMEALVLLERERPDVVLSDLHMPGVDGLELIARIRKVSTHADVPAAALSALVRDEHAPRALAAGYHMYLEKPLAAPDLASAVRRLMSGETLRMH